jgi:hypothetical protein
MNFFVDFLRMRPRVFPGIDQIQGRQPGIIEQELRLRSSQFPSLDQNPDRYPSPGDPRRATADAFGRDDGPMPEKRLNRDRGRIRRDQTETLQALLAESVKQFRQGFLGDSGLSRDHCNRKLLNIFQKGLCFLLSRQLCPLLSERFEKFAIIFGEFYSHFDELPLIGF